MNRKSTALVLLIMLFCTNAHAAKDWVRRFEAGFKLAGKIPTHNNMGTGAYWGGELAYGINQNFGIGFEAGNVNSRFETASPSTGTTIHAGNLSLTPVLLNMIYRVTTDSPRFYGVLGMGGLFTGTDRMASGLSAAADDGYAIKLGAGVDIAANERWSYNLEAGYLFTDAKVDILNASGAEIDSKNLSYWQVSVGVKYLFD